MRFKMKQVDDNDNNLCIICRTKQRESGLGEWEVQVIGDGKSWGSTE